MSELIVTSASRVGEAQLREARLGARFGRLDLMSKLALTAVESLGVDFESRNRDRIGICLGARAGSLSTDVQFWKRRDAVGGPSPTLFAYTLPSAALGEVAIRHRLTGPNLCLVGPGAPVLAEAAEMLWRGEADACLCVECNALASEAAELLEEPAAASACALLLERAGSTPAAGHRLREIDRDMETVCELVCAHRSEG